jgi:hypothetical protein
MFSAISAAERLAVWVFDPVHFVPEGQLARHEVPGLEFGHLLTREAGAAAKLRLSRGFPRWRESGHRRDAYDTMDSVTCVTLKPSEK